METKTHDIKKSPELLTRSGDSSLIPFDELDHFFDEFLQRKWPRLMDWNFPMVGLEKGFPKIDVIEHDKEIEVQAALPGVNKEDLDVSINHHSITIKACSKEDKKKDEGKYFRREIVRGEFQRTFSLPADIDTDSAKAEFKDGILQVTIQKTEKTKNKSIHVK